MLTALEDKQFHLSLEVITKCIDQICPDQDSLSTGRNSDELSPVPNAWSSIMQKYELSNLRWEITCVIESIMLQLFQKDHIFEHRNGFVKGAHLIEKTLFRAANNAQDYKRRDTLLYRVRCCSRAYAERFARRSIEHVHIVPLLLKSRQQERERRPSCYGANAA